MKTKIKQLLVYLPRMSTIVIQNNKSGKVLRGKLDWIKCDSRLSMGLAYAFSTYGVIDWENEANLTDPKRCVRYASDSSRDWDRHEKYSIELYLNMLEISDMGGGRVRIKTSKGSFDILCFPKF